MPILGDVTVRLGEGHALPSLLLLLLLGLKGRRVVREEGL